MDKWLIKRPKISNEENCEKIDNKEASTSCSKDNEKNKCIASTRDVKPVVNLEASLAYNESTQRSNYLSHIRPEVDILTSTARTFIQNGETTEYATQVVGTTLDKGRLFTQYLKKSSRIIYDNLQKQSYQTISQPSVARSSLGDCIESGSEIAIESHNDILDIDGSGWQDADESLFLGDASGIASSTDFLDLSDKKTKQKLLFKEKDNTKLEIHTKNNSWNSGNESNFHVTRSIAIVPLQSISRGEQLEESVPRLDESKVLRMSNLPTYTVRHLFPPSLFLKETFVQEGKLTQHSKANGYINPMHLNKNIISNEVYLNRLPKLYYQPLVDSNDKLTSGIEGKTEDLLEHVFFDAQLSTATYYGFADFTTTVGESVFVFSPSPSTQDTASARVTSVHVEAALDCFGDCSLINKYPSISINDATEQSTKFSSALIEPYAEAPRTDGSGGTHLKIAYRDSLGSDASSTDFTETMHASSVNSGGIDLHLQGTYSRPSDQEVLEIYASLSRAEAIYKLSVPVHSNANYDNAKSVAKNKKNISIGKSLQKSEVTSGTDVGQINPSTITKDFYSATTIFFLGDPIENLFMTTATFDSKDSLSVTTGVSKEVIEMNMLNTKLEDTTKSREKVKVHERIIDEPITKFNEVAERNDSNKTKAIHINFDIGISTPDRKHISTIVPDKEVDSNYYVDPFRDCRGTSHNVRLHLAESKTQLNTLYEPYFERSEVGGENGNIDTQTGTSFNILETPILHCMSSKSFITFTSTSSLTSNNTKLLNMPYLEKNADHKFKTKKSNEDVNEVFIDYREFSNQDDSTITDFDTKSIGIVYTTEDDLGKDIELLYKTLFTTYTYLTTFFDDDSRTTVSTHTEIFTNTVTSTLQAPTENIITTTASAETHTVKNVRCEEGVHNIKSEQELNDKKAEHKIKLILPDGLEGIFCVNEYNKNVTTSNILDDKANIAVTSLYDKKVQTYFTTYTYYTTIFVDHITNILSRTEVHTNYDTTVITPTSVVHENRSTNVFIKEISPRAIEVIATNKQLDQDIIMICNNCISNKSNKMLRSASSEQLLWYIPAAGTHPQPAYNHTRSDFRSNSTAILVTNAPSSNSNGYGYVNNQKNKLIDDQISSESNKAEVKPSSPILLHTSLTTFTYYTTMYSNELTNVVCSLETITNIVTETLQPSKIESVEEETLPITYFTTFTYWTKLAKSGEITTLSREETISNIVTPFSATMICLSNGCDFHVTKPIGNTYITSDELEERKKIPTIFMSTVSITDRDGDAVIPNTAKVLGLTTYYTTYTYYTTEYDVDKTIIHSRYEVVTNVITPTIPPAYTSEIDTAICKDANTESLNRYSSRTKFNDFTNDAVKGITPTLCYKEIQFDDSKKIIDTDGVNNLLFTIAADGSPYEVASSASSCLYVDKERKILHPKNTKITEDGCLSPPKFKKVDHIGNDKTTSYQSKGIGTFTENNSAAIIESISTFLLESNQTKSNHLTISKGVYINPVAAEHSSLIEETQFAIVKTTESMIQSSAEEDKVDGESNEYNNTRLPFEIIKQTFTPVIRPFASRNRPQFGPKKKSIAPDIPTIVTRNDVTPTITATPALRRGSRFSSSRKGAVFGNSLLREFVLGTVTSPSGRPFGRPVKLSPSAANGLLSNIALGSIGGVGRIRLSARPSHQSSPRVGVLIRPSSASSFRSAVSNIFTGNIRARIKSTSLMISSQKNLESHGINTLTLDTSEKLENFFEESEKPHDKEESFMIVTHRNQTQLTRPRRPINRPSGFTGANIHTNMLDSPNQNSEISYKLNSLTDRSKSVKTPTSTITQQPRAKSFLRRKIGSLPAITRHKSSLFPRRVVQSKQSYQENVARKENQKEYNNKSILDSIIDFELENEDDYNEDNGHNNNYKRHRRSNLKYIKYNSTKLERSKQSHTSSRSRREADRVFQARSNFRNKFRHPKHSTTTEEVPSTENFESEMLSQAEPKHRARTSGRFSARYSGHQIQARVSTTTSTKANSYRALRPTRPTNGRAQFTLRNKNVTTIKKSFVRHNTNSYRRSQNTATSQRLLSPNNSNRRIKSYNSNSLSLESSSRIPPRSRNNLHRMRTTARGRNRNEYKPEQDVLPNDGTITVTHVIPAEVTIPLVNGKVTEYKNVVTARTSTELLGSHQYTSFVGNNGQTVFSLLREDSSVNFAGATEITQYVLHESPTTTVIFTPTTIRGRKTSFSHVIPSTVYSVENLVSTSKPHISGNAPLANILLSQLLFGNIDLHAANPLLGALGVRDTSVSNEINALGTQISLPPITEYRTHKSIYVTTVFQGMSTVIPVTFQGKKILTTVYETSAQTITATEIVTDTIITTQAQHLMAKPPQINSVLLQQLLLQQELQSQFEQSTQPILISATLHPEFTNNFQELITNDIRLTNEHDNVIPIINESHSNKVGRKKARKSGKAPKQKHQTVQEESSEGLSIITLYVSGKRPGEFSTILSTLTLNHLSTIHKREVPGKIKQTAYIGDINDLYVTDGSEFITKNILPDLMDSNILNYGTLSHMDLDMLKKSQHDLISQTQTLETIIGNADAWHTKRI